ncbi:deoxyribonuclease [Secundilactobacillus oryzae JCM 18671]|uniref:Deoxyribonuclease n=1 Tax=Secundilactobacillus oryzae JCM 18671 TaxID=1291743 RepID=A0A081BKY0_9LACO|nr:DNA/RNA non-specific endonuclease [Secundilactobacillus oryzae]GAK48698.1 deoxyribonuclease [Secundilactobacillus oryzae JCM 18671]
MTSFFEAIGGLLTFAAIILAIVWVVTRVKGTNSRHTGQYAIVAFVVAILISLFTGPSADSQTKPDHQAEQQATVKKSEHHAESESKAQPKVKKVVKKAVKANDNQVLLSKLVSYTNHESAGPNGDYYWTNGKARFEVSPNLKAGDYHFAGDSLGRASTAKAVLTYKECESSRGSRQGSPLDPVGWPIDNPRVAITYQLTGRTYHGYLFNRSHSIGDSLLGAKSYTSENNFTTGTRPQNVGADQNGGMRYAEETAEDYWESHPNTTNTIHYETTPLYHAKEEVPRGSVVDIKSSDGVINTEIVVINSVEGIQLDYSDGSSDAKEYVPARKPTTATPKKSTSTAQSSQTSHSPTKSGEWTIAGQGMVYVSDSDKYYSRVTNPGNYQYVTESQAMSQGAQRASRGNQYARP